MYSQIENYDPLVRRATKIVKEYAGYPIMPEGDYSTEYIEQVFNYNPLFVLYNLKKQVLDMLLEHTDYKYEEIELLPILEETYGKYETYHKNRILQILINNFKNDVNYTNFVHHSYLYLRPAETPLFYYAYSIFYVARELNNGSGLLFARLALKSIELFKCEKGTAPYGAIRQTGTLLKLSEFARDRSVYDTLMSMIENEINTNGDEETKAQLERQKSTEKPKGCYVATCVYGSYDCPEVWTLRRFRDIKLSSSWFGKLFVKIYYSVSPTIVKHFGKYNIFKKVFKFFLDKFVCILQKRGYNSTPYND